MNGRTCEAVRERLVDMHLGTVPALEAAETRAHLDGCNACAAEATVVAALADTRRRAPEGFAERVLASYADTGAKRRWARPTLSLPLAAAAAGVLLAGALLVRGGSAPDDVVVMAEVADAGLNLVPWPGDDGMLAGAPALDALSTEELEALLEELDR